MKKTILTIILISLIILFANAFIRSSTANPADDIKSNVNVELVQSEKIETDQPEQQNQAAELSCSQPNALTLANCRAIERDILASTVRLLMFTPLMHVEGSGYRIVSGMGHGTIKDGRYLVTHNHYDEPLLSMLQGGDPEDLITINVFDSNGDRIAQIPGRALVLLVVDRETLVFDFGETDGLGFFSALGLPSARFSANASASFTPGMEVAQINWDGNSTHVDWVTIETMTTRSGTPIVKTANCVHKGASGGGVFLHGQHIGNNWSRSPKCDPRNSSESASQISVALNSQSVVAP